MRQFYGPHNEISLLTSFDMDRAIIFLPGMSGGAHSGRYLPVDTLAEANGYACARLALWEGADDLAQQSYDSLFARLDELIAILEQQAFLDFMLVGKSFGGGLALAYEHESISSKVLWAPAIGSAAGAGNWTEMRTKPFAAIPQLLGVQLGTDQLAAKTTPIGIIHGTADTVVPLANSEALVAALPHATLRTIADADHSFREHEAAVELLALTDELL